MSQGPSNFALQGRDLVRALGMDVLERYGCIPVRFQEIDDTLLMLLGDTNDKTSRLHHTTIDHLSGSAQYEYTKEWALKILFDLYDEGEDSSDGQD